MRENHWGMAARGVSKALPARVPTLAAAAWEASASLLLRPRFVDRETAPVKFLLIERFACRFPFRGVCHLDKCEAARPAGCVIPHEADGVDLTVRSKELLELGLFSAERQITYVNFHDTVPLWQVGAGADSVLERPTTRLAQAKHARRDPT